MRVLTKVLVGSRLHNLHNEESDYDYRGVFVNDIKEVLSPFKKQKNRHWIEGDEDNTSYELSDFCKFATSGNPTILEVFWSNEILEDSDEMKVMRVNRHKFLNSTAIFNAHRGYANNQYKKMNLFQGGPKGRKFAIAAIRVLQEGIHLLEVGEYCLEVIANRDFLLEVKNNWDPEKHVPQFCELFFGLEKEFEKTYERQKNSFNLDLEWIEDFILSTYLK